MAQDLIVRPYRPKDESPVVVLWTECGLVKEWNDPRLDIRRKLTQQPELFLVGESSGDIVATVMAGYDGHRGWINYLGVHPSVRRGGIGRQMMTAAEVRLRQMGCPKINLQVRSVNSSAIHFYESLGYVEDDVVSLGRRLVVDGSAPHSKGETLSE